MTRDGGFEVVRLTEGGWCQLHDQQQYLAAVQNRDALIFFAIADCCMCKRTAEALNSECPSGAPHAVPLVSIRPAALAKPS